MLDQSEFELVEKIAICGGRPPEKIKKKSRLSLCNKSVTIVPVYEKGLPKKNTVNPDFFIEIESYDFS